MRLGSFVVAGLLCALYSQFAQAEPVTIRIAWITIGNPPPILEAKKDLAQHWGKSYAVEPMHFQGTPPIMTALAAGEVDIANLSFPSLGNAILNAGLDDLRVIGDEGQDGVPGYHSIEYLVLKDGPIKTVDDLKGKVLATNIIGSATDIGVRVMLKRHGLLANRDYTVIEGAFPNMPSLLLQQKADLVDGVPPFSLDPKFRDQTRTLFTQKDAIGKSQLAVWTARTPFIAKNRAALVDFFADYLRIMRWYLDPANRPQIRRGHLSSPRTARRSSISLPITCASCAGISTRQTGRKCCRSSPVSSRCQSSGSINRPTTPTTSISTATACPT